MSFEFDSASFDFDPLSTWVNDTQSDLNDAIDSLSGSAFDVGTMLDAQTKMNSFQQAVQFTTDMAAGLHTASMSVARNAKG